MFQNPYILPAGSGEYGAKDTPSDPQKPVILTSEPHFKADIEVKVITEV
jgi:hypothetical protein